MAPSRVGTDQHDQIGRVEILIAARHRVRPECTPMTGNGRRHAEPRVGIDVGRAEKAFHQFVGDVIVLGQQLPGEIERDRLGPVAFDDAVEPAGHAAERTRPVDPCAAFRRAGAASGATAAHPDPGFRRAPHLWSRHGQSWRGGRDHRRSSRPRDHPAPPTSRIQPRSTGQVVRIDGAWWMVMELRRSSPGSSG